MSSDYPYYKSVGYRSKLAKGFHSSGGLVHIFIPGVKVDPAQDLRYALIIALCNIAKHA